MSFANPAFGVQHKLELRKLSNLKHQTPKLKSNCISTLSIHENDFWTNKRANNKLLPLLPTLQITSKSRLQELPLSYKTNELPMRAKYPGIISGANRNRIRLEPMAGCVRKAPRDRAGVHRERGNFSALAKCVLTTSLAKPTARERTHPVFSSNRASVNPKRRAFCIQDQSNKLNERIADMKNDEEVVYDDIEDTVSVEVTQEKSAPDLQEDAKSAHKSITYSIIPSNLEEQKKIFFDSGYKVNPVFTYAATKKNEALRILNLFYRPDGTLLSLAVKILDSFIEFYGTESNFLESMGELLTQSQTADAFHSYISALQLEDYISFVFSSNTVTATSITHYTKIGKSVVTIGLPIEYRRDQVEGVLNHEIGTHFIRKYNDQLQPWNGCRKKHKLRKYISTEEGLASLNQLLHIVPPPVSVGCQQQPQALPLQTRPILLCVLQGGAFVVCGAV